MNVTLNKTTEEFLQRCDALIKEHSEKEAEEKYVTKHLQEAIGAMQDKIIAFNDLPVPELNGVPMFNLKIDPQRLTQAAYVKELNEKLPDIINNLVVQGNQLLVKSINESRI